MDLLAEYGPSEPATGGRQHGPELGGSVLSADGHPQCEEKVVMLCRLLFRAEPGGAFRRPSLGAPVAVGPTDPRDWPHEPLEGVDGVPFLVVHGCTVGGYRDPAGENRTTAGGSASRTTCRTGRGRPRGS